MQRKRVGSAVSALLLLLAMLVLTIGDAAAKTIVSDAELSQNKVFIRTDGLACYFCAYGLERTFKKTGRIAAFDMHMKEGIVEITPLRGEPLVDAGQLRQYVHDAGFTPRWIRVELTGRFVRSGERLVFEVAETGERLAVLEDPETSVVATQDLDLPVQLKALGLEHEETAFLLTEVTYERWGPTAVGEDRERPR